MTSKVLIKDIVRAAKLMTDLENAEFEAIEEFKSLYSHIEAAYIVGITGSPGVGKSTLIAALIDHFLKRDLSIGVICIDPSSSLTGGALLGDRVRMRRHDNKENVFIRSLATRGHRGGLARGLFAAMHVLDAMGKDIIIVETVGIGQVEVDITKVADSSILVLIPGLGDDIQVLKAGILEEADIFVINKADTGGAIHLKFMIQGMVEARGYTPGNWTPRIVLTEALCGKGVEELADTIFEHKQFVISSGTSLAKVRERTRFELTEITESYIRNYIQNDTQNFIEDSVDELADRKLDPYSAVQRLMGQLAKATGKVS